MSLLFFLKPSKADDGDTHDGLPKQQYIEVDVIRKPKKKAKKKVISTELSSMPEKLEGILSSSLPITLKPLPSPLPSSNQSLLSLLDSLQLELSLLREREELQNNLTKEQEKLKQISIVKAKRDSLLEQIDEEILLLLFGEV